MSFCGKFVHNNFKKSGFIKFKNLIIDEARRKGMLRGWELMKKKEVWWSIKKWDIKLMMNGDAQCMKANSRIE